MGSAAITVGGGAAIGEGHRTAGAGWTGLVGAGRGRLPPVCAPFPGSGGGPEFESSFAW